MPFKCALITGATSGIGEAFAHLLAAERISLILSGRNRARLEKIKESLHAEQILVADLQDKQQREELVRLIYEKAPDLVVNNAGFGIYGDALSISVAEQLTILEVNAAAALELTLEAARTLIQANKRGVIMNISSVAGEYPCPGMSVYGAAKSFLTHVSQALNTELSSKGVSVLVSCPGMVATDFANRAAKKQIALSEGPILTPQFAAEQIWKQIKKGKEKTIFNWQYRVGSLLATFVPESIIKNVIWKRIKKRL
jgi:uncharacterized protein